MKINAAMLFAGSRCTIAHASLAYHSAKREFLDDLSLVRFLANRSRRTRGSNFPFSLLVFDHHGTAVIKDAILKLNAGRQFPALVQIFVHRIPASEENAGDFHLISHFQGANLLLRKWRLEMNH